MATLAVMALLAAASVSAAQSPGQEDHPSAVELELRQLDELAAKMQRDHDVAAARRLLADDYLFLQADGNVSNKTENLAIIGDPAFVCGSLVTEEVRVRVYGDAAVITGVAVMAATYKGQQVGGRFRYTDVWVKREGRWQNVSSQATRLPEKR